MIKPAEIEAEIRNKLQPLKTVLEILAKEKKPSKTLIKTAEKNIGEIIELLENI